MQKGIEPLLKWLRIKKIEPFLPSDGVLVDLGCDEEMTLVKRQMGRMKQVYGIDIVAKPQKFGNATILQGDLTKTFALPDNSADAVTMLAVLEHLPHPEKVVREVYRILKPGGVFLVTVPAPVSEPILEFMSKIGLVRDEMIEQHETYFTPALLQQTAKKAGFRKIKVETWELGVNTFLQATK